MGVLESAVAASASAGPQPEREVSATQRKFDELLRAGKPEEAMALIATSMDCNANNIY